jgi:hypothetical protein
VVRVEAIEASYAGSERADKIRAFLQDKTGEWGIEFVLLVGSPDPYDQYVGAGDLVGTVPMKMAWPRGDGYTGVDSDGDATYGYCPTDHYYGDLSSDWDVDGDGYAAGSDDYRTVTTRETVTTNGMDYTLTYSYADYGVDFDMEVKVGRIPFDDLSDINLVLNRTIDYETLNLSSAPDAAAARQRIYIADSFYASDTDYAYLGREVHDESFSHGFNVITFYQQSSSSNSVFSSTYPLTDLSVVHHWQDYSAGIVLLTGHGNRTSISVGYSSGGTSYWEGTLMSTSYVSGLKEIGGAFVFQGACQNGLPEESSNLAHRMLAETAVTTIAGTRNSWYLHGQTDFGTSCTIGDLGYFCTKSHAQRHSAGYAMLYMRSRATIGGEGLGENNSRHNLMTYNLYGDPSVRWTY